VTQQHLIFYGCLIVAVILHEISHGVVAYAYGDDTAKRAGRLTLNPIPHIDPMGSIILPALAVLANLPVLGCTGTLLNPRVSLTGDILASFAVVNLLLGLFNLLPIPPLDGSSLIERLLPARYLPTWWKFRPYGFLVLFLGLFYFNFFGRILSPFLTDLCRYLVR
jgi:Zn-dependent protease